MTANETDHPLDLTQCGWARLRVPDENAEAVLRGVVDCFTGPDGPWWRAHLTQVVARRVDERAAVLASLSWAEYDDVRLGLALEGSLSAEIALRTFLPPVWTARFTPLERRVLFETLLTVHALAAMEDDPFATVGEPAEATLDPRGRAALPAVRFNFELLAGSTVALELRRRLGALAADRRPRPDRIARLTLAVGLHERLMGGWQLVPDGARAQAMAELPAIIAGRRGIREMLNILGKQAQGAVPLGDPSTLPAARAAAEVEVRRRWPRDEQDAVLNLAMLEAVDAALRAPGGLVDVVHAALQTPRVAGNAVRRAGRAALRVARRRAREVGLEAADAVADAAAPMTAHEIHVAELRAEMLALLLSDERGRLLFEGDELRPEVAAAAAEGRITQADLAGWLRLSPSGAYKWRQGLPARWDG